MAKKKAPKPAPAPAEEKQVFPNNTVTEPELVQRHLQKIMDCATILEHGAVMEQVNQLPPGKAKQMYLKIADLVLALDEHPDFE